MEQLGRNERRWLRWTGAIAVLCFLVAIPLILDAGFGAEDFLLAPRALRPWGQEMQRYFGAPDPEAIHYYRPVCRAVQRTLQVFFDTNPLIFHAWNLLLHVLVAWLVYRLALAVCDNKLFAQLAGLVFLIHPAHDEPLIWLSGISVLGETVFHLVGLIAFDRFLTKRTWTAGISVIVCFVFGVLSKESGVTMLLTLPLLWWYRGHKSWNLWPYGGVAAATAAMAIWRNAIGVDSSIPLSNLTANPLAWGRNLVLYTVQFLVPVRSFFRLIGFDNYYRLRDMLPSVPATLQYGVGAAVILVLVMVVSKRIWRRWPPIAVLSSTLAIAAVGPLLISRYTGMRLMYLFSGMLTIALVSTLIQMSKRRIALYAFCVWIVLMAVSFVERAEAWRESGHLAGRILDAALATSRQTPDHSTLVFRGIPGRHLGGSVFPVAFSEAVMERNASRRLTVFNYDDPHEKSELIPPNARWYQWDGQMFLPAEPKAPNVPTP